MLGSNVSCEINIAIISNFTNDIKKGRLKRVFSSRSKATPNSPQPGLFLAYVRRPSLGFVTFSLFVKVGLQPYTKSRTIRTSPRTFFIFQIVPNNVSTSNVQAGRCYVYACYLDNIALLNLDGPQNLDWSLTNHRVTD